MDFSLSDSDSSLSLDHLQLGARPYRACLGTSCSTIGSVIQRYRDGRLSDAALGIKTSEEIVSAIRTLRDVTSADGTVDWERFWAQRPLVNFRIAITSRSLRRIIPEVRASGLGILHLRKARSGLEKVGCVTVGALLDLAHSGIGKLSNFGATAHVEVVEALLALSKAVLDDGIVDWLVYAGVRGFPLIPDVESEEIGGEATLGLLEGICKQIIPEQLDDRAWQIFRRRILLPEANRETLETIGSVYGLTRERIRQIESEAIDAIREPLFDENYSGLSFRFRPELHKAFDDARKHYASVGLPAWPENRWLNELAKLWKVQMPAILRYDELLIELFGYRRINLDHTEMEQLVVRDSTSKVEAKRLASLVEGVHDVLSDESAGLDAFGLAAALKHRKLDLASLDEVPVLIELCSTAEGLGEDAYRLRFDALSGRTEQAYRILSIHGSPMHHSDIFREINRQLPLQKRIREKRNLVNQLSADSRLQPIGKTGLWTLAEWGLDTRALVDVIEDVLTEADEPMPLEAIWERVLAKRPGSLVSVVMLLKGHPDRFRRAGARMYGLATWDEDSSAEEWWGGDEIAQFVKEFFSKRNGEPVDFRSCENRIQGERGSRLGQLKAVWPSTPPSK